MSLAALQSSMEAAVIVAAAPIKTVGLGMAIDGRPILQDITLEIGRGEFAAVLGANGAGKSTLLKVIATLARSTEGTLELFGKTVGRDSAELRRRIGLIAHQSMLYRELTARENLLFFAKLYGIAEPVKRAELLLEVIGLSNRANDPVKSFSRGMVQRVAIARSLLHDPELILADEPFDGLDAPSVAATEQLLRHLHNSGKTILLVNHDISQSLQLASRAVVMRKGRIVIDAAAQSLNASQVLIEVSGA